MKLKPTVYTITVFLKKYYKHIALATVALITAICVSVYSNLEVHYKYMNYLINKNIEEYNKVNLEHICSLTNCNNIYIETSKNNFTRYQMEDMLRFKENIHMNPYHISDNMYIYSTSLLLHSKKAKAYISIDYMSNIKELLENFTALFIFIDFIFWFILFNTFKKEQKEAMLKNIGNEAILANKSITVIAENIHHELNTPLEVLDNKITKIYNVLHEYLEKEERTTKNDISIDSHIPKKIIKLEKDFDFVKISIKQIFAVLNKMKNFKSLRYSNGNKTLYDIIDGAFRIIAISNSDFDYDIDVKFKNYKMISKILKNVDLLNVLINHIKNSLEANATFMEVESSYANGVLKIKIKDNGAGIPPDVLENIFEPNFSTKQVGDIIRGNGMYLNKYIIEQAGGDIIVKDRDTRGTIVIVKIPAEKI